VAAGVSFICTSSMPSPPPPVVQGGICFDCRLSFYVLDNAKVTVRFSTIFGEYVDIRPAKMTLNMFWKVRVRIEGALKLAHQLLADVAWKRYVLYRVHSSCLRPYTTDNGKNCIFSRM